MFSGTYPFHDIKNDFQVINAIRRGKRPSRPSHDLCQTRGLSDEIWGLIETCWTGESSGRPTANRVMQQLHTLYNRPAHRQSRHTYSVTEPAAHTNQLMEELKPNVSPPLIATAQNHYMFEQLGVNDLSIMVCVIIQPP